MQVIKNIWIWRNKYEQDHQSSSSPHYEGVLPHEGLDRVSPQDLECKLRGYVNRVGHEKLMREMDEYNFHHSLQGQRSQSLMLKYGPTFIAEVHGIPIFFDHAMPQGLIRLRLERVYSIEVA